MAPPHQTIGTAVRTSAPLAILAAALLAGFLGLVAAPRSLIVDGQRPWVDEGHRPGVRAIGNDLTGLFLPRHLWQGMQLRRFGRVPRWDDRGFAGRPNAGNPQAGLWYPPVRLAWIWGGPAAPGWLTVAHLFWAGAGMLALGRAIGLGRFAATVAGVVLMLNPYVIAQVHEGHLPHVWSASWYPWAFLGAVLLRRGDRLGLLLLPTSLALSLMAGHPQEGMYLAVALGCWAAIDAAGPTSSARWERAFRWALAFMLAIGLAAVEWVPVVLARPWAAGPLGGEGASGAGPYHLHPSNLMQLISPRALGGPADYFGRANRWETMLSVGWAPLVLVLAGLERFPIAWRVRRTPLTRPSATLSPANGGEGRIQTPSPPYPGERAGVRGSDDLAHQSRTDRATHPDRRAVRGWAVLLVSSVVHAAGASFGLAALVAAVPGMGGLRVPARSLFLAATAAAVLSGMGVDAIARAVDRDGAARRFGAAVGLLTLFVVAGLAANRIGNFTDEGTAIGPAGLWASACERIVGDRLFLGSLAATAAIIAWRARWPDDRGRGAAAIGAVAIVELIVSAAIALPVSPPERFLGPDAVGAAIARVRPDGPFRVRSRDAFYTDLHAWRDDVHKTNLGDLFQLRHAAEVYRTLYPMFDEPGRPTGRPLDPRLARAALDRLGVALIVADRPLRLAVGPVVASGTRGGATFAVVENPTAMPRAYVVPGTEVAGAGEPIARLAAIDPRSAVLMTADPLLGLVGPRQPFTTASYEPDGPDRLIVRVSTDAPGLLVVTDAWMPGWSATVDGRPAPVLRGDHAFRVVPLPASGSHSVVMTYRAPGLWIGSIITATTAAVLIGTVAIGLARFPRIARIPDSPRSRPRTTDPGSTRV